MKIVFRAFDGPSDWGWVQLQVPILRVEDTQGIMAIDEETDTTIGAAIFDNWTENSVQVHYMLTNIMLLRHGFLEEIADYIFNVCGKKKMYGTVPSHNVRALKMDKHIGFTEQARLKDAVSDGIDLIVLELTRENCQHLPAEILEVSNG